MLLGLQKGIIYGPVNSRRLGRSLGINLLPTGKKLCNYDCLYCQYGRTRIKEDELKDRNNFPSVDEVLDAVRKSLVEMDIKPDYITFSGNGEPSLHPDFTDIAEGISELRKEYSPNSKTCILTNSTGISNPVVLKAFEHIDVKIMKLDCADQDCLSLYNHPVIKIDMTSQIKSLASINDVWIQSLFASGNKGNSREEYLEKWCEAISKISPAMVMIYSLDRDYPSRDISPLGRKELEAIKARIKDPNVRVEVY